MFYRFAVWINKKIFVKHKKSPHTNATWIRCLELQWPTTAPRIPAVRPLGSRSAGKVRPTNALSIWSGTRRDCTQTHNSQHFLLNRVYVLSVQPSVMVPGWNHRNIIELARAYWSPLLFCKHMPGFRSLLKISEAPPITKGQSSKARCACLFYGLKHLVSS